MLHIRTDLDSSDGGSVVNVGLWDCSGNEDFVGQISRSSRRMSFRNLELGVLNAYLVKTKFVLKRFKKKRGL